jgi:hypothetical protein
MHVVLRRRFIDAPLTIGVVVAASWEEGTEPDDFENPLRRNRRLLGEFCGRSD